MAENGIGRHGLGRRSVKRIWGVFGSVNAVPSASSISPTSKAKGRRSGPTASKVSPWVNLFRREQVASPSGVQDSTMAQTCHSRMYREFSVYCPGKP